MKRILITSTDVMMLQFLIPHVFYLRDNGFEVEVACSNVENHIEELKAIFCNKVPFKIVQLKRSPLALKNIKGLIELKNIIKAGMYDYVWTNEPVMGVMTRLAVRLSKSRIKSKVLYVAHGFHFYKGAPLKNWIFFYPIEWLMSFITEEIITINREDYNFAKKHFKHPSIKYFPGIGIDTGKFFKDFSIADIRKKREEIGLEPGKTMLLSVGELEMRKNHETTIRAIARLGRKDVKLYICGVGSQEKGLKALIRKLNLDDKVYLLGYRYDINELCHTTDAFVFFTFQEGLSVALMEAMAVGTPCILSRIRGNVDLIEKERGIYADPHSVTSCAEALLKFLDDKTCLSTAIPYNRSKIKNFDINRVKKLMLREIENL